MTYTLPSPARRAVRTVSHFLFSVSVAAVAMTAGGVAQAAVSPVGVTAPTVLPAGQVNSAYNTVLTAQGGSGGYTWTVDSGALPAGMRLWSNGALTGAPVSAGTTSFSLRATDTSGVSATKPVSVTVSLSGQSPLPSAFSKIGPGNGARNLSSGIVFSWEPAAGATSYEICIDTLNNAQCDSKWVNVGAARSYSAKLSGGTIYNWEVRALNSSGGVGANVSWWQATTK